MRTKPPPTEEEEDVEDAAAVATRRSNSYSISIQPTLGYVNLPISSIGNTWFNLFVIKVVSDYASRSYIQRVLRQFQSKR